MFTIENIENDTIRALAELSFVRRHNDRENRVVNEFDLERFAMLIVNECIKSIETYEIPVGNSAAGEIAAEWTYDALIEIRDDIVEKFSARDQ
jgi:Fe2+ or Zn2+ uptake regulation protein